MRPLLQAVSALPADVVFCPHVGRPSLHRLPLGGGTAQESIPEAGSDGTGQVTEEATGKQELAVYFLPLNQVKETHALRTHAHAPSGRERN